LQILGCELHKNAFGGPAGGAIALSIDSLTVIRGGEGGMGRKALGIGSGRKRGEGRA